MANSRLIGYIFIMLVLIAGACKKAGPATPKDDPRIDSVRYCNDPRAINYNWDFPGVPDSTVCFYPTGIYRGSYVLQDSVLNADYTFSFIQTVNLQVYARSFTEIGITGFCGPDDTLYLEADRALKATLDTLVGFGQVFCRPVDTVSGYLTKSLTDTANFKVFFTVQSDTGITYHTGTAIKQ